jgi:uncharacterized membrane protein SirB2
MTHSVQAFSEWLAATPLSTLIQNVQWIIPAVQTIHILSIAIVMSSVSMIALRVLGIMSRTQPLAAVAQRFLPWIWWTLLVLLLSGSALIIGEPERSLGNPAFILKMSMLCTVLILTLAFQRGLRRDAQYWETSPGRRVGGRLIAAVSLGLWVGIVFAGRWIAYLNVGSA